MKKWTMITLGLLSMAAIATTTVAYGAMGHGPGRGPGYGPGAQGNFQGMGKLDLSTEQMAKINKLRESQFAEVAPLREQMVVKRDALRKLWLEPNPDQAKITAAQKELNAIRDQMQAKMTTFRLDVNKVLTPEQREKAKFFAAGRGFGPMQGRGPGAQMGPGKAGRGGADCGCPAYGPKGRGGAWGPGYGQMGRGR